MSSCNSSTAAQYCFAVSELDQSVAGGPFHGAVGPGSVRVANGRRSTCAKRHPRSWPPASPTTTHQPLSSTSGRAHKSTHSRACRAKYWENSADPLCFSRLTPHTLSPRLDESELSRLEFSTAQQRPPCSEEIRPGKLFVTTRTWRSW